MGIEGWNLWVPDTLQIKKGNKTPFKCIQTTAGLAEGWTNTAEICCGLATAKSALRFFTANQEESFEFWTL